MDSETGECFRDKETGEMPASAKVNLETGESEINRTMPEKQNSTRKFRIPNPNPQPKPKSQSGLQVKKNKPSMLNDVPSVRSTNDVVPVILFLLPTILLFYPVIGACVTLLEVILHVWAHKKNRMSSNKSVYYQSPLHIFLREFCAACKEEHITNKLTSIQDKRNYKFIKYSIDYVQGTVM